MKQCSKCNEKKLYSEFGKYEKNIDGHNGRCKSCVKEYQREHHQKNRDKISQKQKEYRRANAEIIKERERKRYEKNIDKKKQYNKEYHMKNADAIRENKKKYYENNADRKNEYDKEYRKNNAEKLRKHSQSEQGRVASYNSNMKRRSRKYHVYFTRHQRKDLLERDNYTCQSCFITVHDRFTGDWNTPDKAHIDHKIPLSKGGASDPYNLQTLCRQCNLSKQDNVFMSPI